MVARLLLLVVLVVVALVAWDSGWKIDESDVHRYYERQEAAIRSFDHESLCDDVASDFRSDITSYASGRRVGDAAYDADGTCRATRELLEGMQALSVRSNGLVGFDIAVDVRSVRMGPGRRDAMVETVTTMKMGEILVARSRGTERLSRALWRVRSHGGEGQAWSY